MHEVPVRLHACSLNAAQEEELDNLIANGELNRAVDVTVSERASVMRAADSHRCFVIDEEGRHAEIDPDLDTPIGWDQLDWNHEPS